ncbi:hypothetical protein [Acinetobacter beijerinckii]|uniref:hypothetical protein n=1 Tax=Acinetobacter beijerinckii TaxID=262668 RepID=UPI004054F91D
MVLLSLEQIRERLDVEFEPLEPILTGFRMLQASISSLEISTYETKFNVIFPLSFKNIISKYNFGDFTIGPIVFGCSVNYLDELIELDKLFNQNLDNKRDIKEFIVVAVSDPYLYLLDLRSSNIFALDSDLSLENRFFIALNFEKFIQGIGTLMLLRDTSNSENELAIQICKELGSECVDFWKTLSL